MRQTLSKVEKPRANTISLCTRNWENQYELTSKTASDFSRCGPSKFSAALVAAPGRMRGDD